MGDAYGDVDSYVAKRQVMAEGMEDFLEWGARSHFFSEKEHDENGDIPKDELEWYAQKFTKECWGVECDVPIVLVNRKWKRVRAQFLGEKIFVTDYSQDPPQERVDYDVEIRFSRKVNAQRTKHDVLASLLHELVHWRLLKIGEPFRDTDESFVKECFRVGAPISEAKGAKKAAEKLTKRVKKERVS